MAEQIEIHLALEKVTVRGVDIKPGHPVPNARALGNYAYLVSSDKIEAQMVDAPSESKTVAPVDQLLAKLDQSVPALTRSLDDIEDVDQLQRLLDAEQAGKTRTSAVQAIEARIQEVLHPDAAAESDNTDG